MSRFHLSCGMLVTSCATLPATLPPASMAAPVPSASSAALAAAPRDDFQAPLPPFAPRGSEIPLAPAAALRPPPADELDHLIGVPPGTVAELIGESGEESYADLQRVAPDALERMEAIAGGKDRLIAFLNNRDTLLPLIDLTGVGLGGTDIVLYNRASKTILLPMGAGTAADEAAPIPAIFGRFMYYISNASGASKLLRYDLVTQQIDTLPRVNLGNPIVFPSTGLATQTLAFQEITPAGSRLRFYDAMHDVRLVPGPMQNESCLVPRIDLLEQRVVYGTIGPDGRSCLRIYDMDTATIETPPYVNEGGNASQGCFSFDGNQLLYISDRHGSPDIYLTDLRTGFTDDMSLINSSAIEALPRFIGANEIVFNSNHSGKVAYFTYRLDTHVLEPIPLDDWLPPPPGVLPPIVPLAD